MMKVVFKFFLFVILYPIISYNSDAHICRLTDEFESPTLDSNWIHLQHQYYTIEMSNG